VLLDFFDGARSMAAIQQHRVTVIGQIPAMFQFEWRLPDYASYDRSSLETILFGGQQVPQPFIARLREMGPILGTGLGLTESAGFCTYTRPTGDPAEMDGTLGVPMPVYPMSIREPMRGDGAAGEELPDGQIGHICFRGPQTFLGYVNHPEATARTISTDGWLYTGDLGLKDARGLKLAGRAKWVIKPAGHQVFPGDVEAHIARLDAVAQCGVVGVEHRTLFEAIVAFVEPKPGAALSPDDLRRHGKDLASFMRPLHYVLVEPGKMPLNRTAKVDYVKLSELARAEIQTLRERGRWDN
jgi:acyl-CoA synthetase (AMP-forming)/AMP-acid ligase II